jgi:phosphomannomutase
MTNKNIFKAYDIRGLYPEELNADTANRIGKSFIKYLRTNLKMNPEAVVIGYDMRSSSPLLAQELISGLLDQGQDVINIGQINTDLLYFSANKMQCPGIMVTASHNPKQYNGFKMITKVPFGIGAGEGMEELYDYVVENNFTTANQLGVEKKDDYSDEYMEKLLSLIDKTKLKKYKIVADTGNGMAGKFVEQVFSHLPIDLIKMNFAIDGENPVHGWDPLKPENRVDLEKKVVEVGADFGLAFDGDADRLFVIDNKGKMIAGDFVTALLAEYFLARNEKDKNIIYDIRASWAVRDIVAKAGGKSFANRVGHTFIKQRMIKENAIFAGEGSGHYYFKDFYKSDSALLTALYFIEYLSSKEVTTSKLVESLEQKYFITGEINSKVDDPDKIISKIEEIYNDGEISHEDGLSVEYSDWHFNLRKSNTEPLLRLSLEAMSKELMEEKREEILKSIKS